VTAAHARDILQRSGSAERILIAGAATVTLEAAEVFAAAPIRLLGNESQSVGPEEAPMAVHKILLAAEIVPLEGIRLQDVPCGVYFLSAAPITLAGADGAPCRAILIEMP
jgi:arylformamidase